ncbi:MAG: methyl-viologen-reducing hydrogenase subunit delta [Bacteroidetes bacterium CG02_land_8_20_14_3_00_31_25]|nr:hydrogenase iron-sulfur subunit [Bacteroidota bacterium]PIV63279.1 MAG: methyl-viologen-reducing hydrogenase subunit delta [Bacteroidetes bacterium CG02_land_8_20_14_3_00_31_25]PIX35971.1 MAG: methyl-viologen-reducing hydrogenase subunit delta [Bacteroidetes bacterium CG_4_8_14_3_um_filter_31_14]PIY05539.1 MAG: methyl-viologen-reducing hydrogenase subunit delta [Bacteroidetes bacterium CG_4_10_14_3_um_filter_31_20]
MSVDNNFQPKIIGILCNWCCYGGADLCGVSRFQYPPYIRIIRVMCSGRVDLLHIIRAFANGNDGVFIGGCHLGDCHYVTQGNFNAFSMVQVCKKILKSIGVHPERLRIEWVSAGEGIRFANFMNEYSALLIKLGPLGKAEGIDKETLVFKFKAVKKIIPYIKLVLNQRLHASERTEEAYHKFFASEEFEKLFNELILDKFTKAQITILLQKKNLSISEIAKYLNLSHSEVAKHINDSSKQGLVRYDVDSKCYALA